MTLAAVWRNGLDVESTWMDLGGPLGNWDHPWRVEGEDSKRKAREGEKEPWVELEQAGMDRGGGLI